MDGDHSHTETPEVEIAALVEQTRAVFDSGRTRPMEWRLRQLEAFDRLLEEGSRAIIEAARDDLGKPELEAFSAEVAHLQQELARTRSKLRAWLEPESVPTVALAQPARSSIVREPLGVVLIIAPWNFPFQLAFAPLIGALAAGNCAVLKPSELSPRSAAVIADLVPRYLDAEAVRVVEGGVPESTALLAQRFDHIFFTGSPRVGRIVMAAAARHLTPVTLELGGKCPCIVDRSAKLEVAARRICWGKFTNAGQVCVAPDYVLVDEVVHEPLLELLAATVREFFGEEPERSPDFGRIVNASHHRRLAGLLEGGTPVVGGELDEAKRYIAPTVLRDVDLDSALMQEEIFGPLLPVIPVASVDAAIDFVNARPKPLGLYVFSEDKKVARRVIERSSSGAVTINHTWLHLAVPALPFGGVGESGMGCYHGRHSVETFSHRKAVLDKSTLIDPALLYPPFTERKKKWIKRFL